MIREDIQDSEFAQQEKIQGKLNTEIWDRSLLIPEIRTKLLSIAKEFIKFLELPDLKVTDAIVSGSMANYNWTPQSDIDLHIVIDFSKLKDNQTTMRKYFDMKKALWTELHDIKIKNHDVECYVQNSNEKHISTGIYSVAKNKWLIHPSVKKVDYDVHGIKTKANAIANSIDRLQSIPNKNDRYLKSTKIKDKIKKMRQIGLIKDGEFSTENLAFKVLRRSGYIEKLTKIKNDALDEILSLA